MDDPDGGGCLLALFVYCIAMAIEALKIGAVLYVGWLIVRLWACICNFELYEQQSEMCI